MLKILLNKLRSIHSFIKAQSARTITAIAAAIGLTAIAMAFLVSSEIKMLSY